MKLYNSLPRLLSADKRVLPINAAPIMTQTLYQLIIPLRIRSIRN